MSMRVIYAGERGWELIDGVPDDLIHCGFVPTREDGEAIAAAVNRAGHTYEDILNRRSQLRREQERLMHEADEAYARRRWWRFW